MIGLRVKVSIMEHGILIVIAVKILNARRFSFSFVLIVVTPIIMGLTFPILVNSVIMVNSIDIPESGIQITHTVFASLSSVEPDSAIIIGNWSKSELTGTYHLNLPPPSITDEEGKNIALSFIDADLRNLLYEDPENPKKNDRNMWRYVFHNGTRLENGIYEDEIYVCVTLNAVTGRVIGYREVLSEEFIDSIYSQMGYCSVENETEALDIGYGYLSEHNYSLPLNTKLLDVRREMFSYKTNVYEPENWTRLVYITELGIDNNGILPQRAYQGPLIQIDARTGRVFRFEYFALQIPQVSTANLVSDSTARVVAKDYILSLSEVNAYSERNVYLRLIPHEESQWDFDLAWAFAYEMNSSSEIHVEEFYVNARSGTRYYSDPYFSGGVYSDSSLVAKFVFILFSSTIIGITGYSATMKRIRRES